MQEAADAQEDARDAVRKQLQALTAEFRSARSQTRDASLSIKCAAPPPPACAACRKLVTCIVLPAQQVYCQRSERSRCMV